MSKHPLSGGKVDVSGDKLSDLGVIITALEVIPAGFFIIDIPTVAERL